MSRTGTISITDIFRKFKESLQKQRVVLFPEDSTIKRKYPPISFENCSKLHRGDPDVASAMEFIRDVAVGAGFNITVNEEYSEGKNCLDYLSERCETFRLDTLAQEEMLDLIGYGNSWAWKGSATLSPKMLLRIGPYQVKSYELSEDQLFFTHLNLQKRQIPAEELFWLSYNHIDKSPLGFGVLQALLTPYGDRENFADIKASIQQSMKNQIKKFSAYNELWAFEGLDRTGLKEVNDKIQRMGEEGGKRIATNVKGQVIPSVPERMRGLDLYAEKLWDSFYLALKTPYPKLILGARGFTEAAANAAVFVGERKVDALRRYFKREYEQLLFKPWTEEGGYDWKEAKPRLNWRIYTRPDPNILLPILRDLSKTPASETTILSALEVRKILADMGLPIKPEQVKISKQPQQPLQEPETPRSEQPVESEKKKDRKTPRLY